MRKISASFLSSRNIPMDLIKLNETDADYIHIDVMDGKFVKNKTMPFSEMKNIYKYTTKRLEVHLMVDNPSKYIPLYAELNTECIMFHIESSEDILKNLELIKSFSIKCGLAINPDTKINELIPYLPYLDQILVMSVFPGEGGQKFIDGSGERINEIKELIRSYDLNILINVDGGICDTVLDKVENADILTAGSYIINSSNYQEKITSLR
ncbi:MAG: ribulose-phosphate 3-epimerase [Bacilli bacterium]|nr:ribulose-phosphate 3-epimerase [Bacilli bacterium]